MINISVLPKEDGFIRITPLWQALNISRTTLWRWATHSDFPNALKLSGGTVVFDVKEVRAWLQSKEVKV